MFVVCCAHCHRDLASQSDSAFEDGIRDDVDSPDPTTELSPTRQPPSRSRARRPTKTPARCLSTLRTHTNLWHKVAGMQLALRGASSPALFRANKRGQSRSRPQRMLCKTTSLTFSANNIRRNSAFFYRLWLFFHLFASVFCLKQLFYLLHIFKCLGMYTRILMRSILTNFEMPSRLVMHKACLTVVSHTYNSFILNQFNDDCFPSIQIPTEIAFFKIEFLAHPQQI